MAEHSLSKYRPHMSRNKGPLLNPVRNPGAVTDKHTTASPPKAGMKSGGGITQSGGGPKGAGR